MSGDYVERLRAWRRQLNADHRAWYERNGHPVPEPLHPADEEVPCRLGCGTDLRGPDGEHLPLLLADIDAAVAELEKLRHAVQLEREAFDRQGARVMQQRAELAASWKERDAATTRAETAERELAELRDEYANLQAESTQIASRAGKYRKELAELRERIGKGETPDSHCPWCGMAMWLDADGLAPLHNHPVNDGRCPGIGRRPSDQWWDGKWKSAEETPWTDHGDGWKSRRPTLSDLQGPFTGLLGPFGVNDGDQT